VFGGVAAATAAHELHLLIAEFRNVSAEQRQQFLLKQVRKSKE